MKSFITNLYFLLSCVLILSLASCKSEEESHEHHVMGDQDEQVDTKKLRHVVLFKFKDGTSEADIKKVEEAFKALPAKIPEIKDFEWGTNNSPEGLDKGFTHCFFLTFDSEEGRATYLPHPDHKAFGEVLGPFLEDVTVVDYWIGK